MSCNCESRFDSIMKFLEDMRTEIGFVKTKCIRIEKEILGITAESELTADALMETATVRHLVEKMTFDVGLLTEESRKRASAEEKREQEVQAARTLLQIRLSKVADEKMKKLKLKYDVVDSKTFQTELHNLLEEFHSQAKEALWKKGFSSSVIQDAVEAVVRTTDSDVLYKTHFLDKYTEVRSFIWKQYGQLVEVYTNEVVERRAGSHEPIVLKAVGLLDKLKLCEETAVNARQELLNAVRQTIGQTEANRSLLEHLTENYSQRLTSKSSDSRHNRIQLELEARLKREIIDAYHNIVPLFLDKFRQNIENIRATLMGKHLSDLRETNLTKRC